MADEPSNIYPISSAPDVRRAFLRTVLIIAAVGLGIVAGICVMFRLTTLAEVSIVVLIAGAACAALAVLPFLVPRGSIMPMGNLRFGGDWVRLSETEEVRSLARQDTLDLRRDRGKSLAMLAGSGLVIVVGLALGLLA